MTHTDEKIIANSFIYFKYYMQVLITAKNGHFHWSPGRMSHFGEWVTSASMSKCAITRTEPVTEVTHLAKWAISEIIDCEGSHITKWAIYKVIDFEMILFSWWPFLRSDSFMKWSCFPNDRFSKWSMWHWQCRSDLFLKWLIEEMNHS